MTIAVGILAGRGIDEHVSLLSTRLASSPLITSVIVLTGRVEDTELPSARLVRFPPASENKRGQAREQLRLAVVEADCDFAVLFDDDVQPAEDYFATLSMFEAPKDPLLFAGMLENADGRRSWDICAFRKDGHPALVPYDRVGHPDFHRTTYLSGPQHILNRAGQALAVSYPDLDYGEDRQYCWDFRRAGGKMGFLPYLKARLIRPHPEPNYFEDEVKL